VADEVTRMKHWRNDTDRERPKDAEQDQSQCHFLRHKFHTHWPGIEPDFFSERLETYYL
jgi:hypothetical protein